MNYSEWAKALGLQEVGLSEVIDCYRVTDRAEVPSGIAVQRARSHPIGCSWSAISRHESLVPCSS